MNALELADSLDEKWARWKGHPVTELDAVAMLRRQHEAIVKLREALADLSWYADQLEQIVYPIGEQDIDHEIQAKAKQALKDTEKFK